MAGRTNKKVYRYIPLTLVICLMVCISSFLQAEEILDLSKLKTKEKKLTIQRNIFSPDTMKPPDPMAQQPRRIAPPPKIKEPPKQVEMEQDVEDEILKSVTYDGYIIKKPKNFALISVNGEFYAVGPDDVVVEKIKILKIDKKTITVEVDSRKIEIQLKGDESDDEK